MTESEMVLLGYMITVTAACIYMASIIRDYKRKMEQLAIDKANTMDRLYMARHDVSRIQAILGNIYIPIKDKNRPSFSVSREDIIGIRFYCKRMKER